MSTKRKKRSRKEVSTIPSSGSRHPYRKMDLNLFTPLPTLNCATEKNCIPCSYKIANFDIALDSSFTKCVPNTRPELCPRSSISSIHTKETISDASCYGYYQGMKIMTIGDGDFSFSLALARVLHNKHNPSQLVATSYESFETLKRVYPRIQETISELKKLGVQVFYRVDATNLETTLPIESTDISGRSGDKDSLFHRIIWNFPCTAIANGQDGQNQQMHDNQMLVRKFVKQCVGYLHPLGGEIQFLHKTKPPYDQWGLESVAVADSVENPNGTEGAEGLEFLWTKDEPCPFEYKGRVVFDKCLLPPYTPRKALDKKSFPCHDACLYVFGFQGRDRVDSTLLYPTTIPAKGPNTIEDRQIPKEEMGGIIPVTEGLIDELRSMHLLLGSQTDRKKRKLKHAT